MDYSSPRPKPCVQRVSFRGLWSSALALSLVIGAASPALVGSAAQAQVFVGIQVNLAPPPLPVYVQPPLPGPDYIWTPGYWAWDPDYYDYYWVPGTWVMAPRPGYLWTPGYWGWSEGLYVFHGGYWGPHIGYYGGVNYGFGYNGIGFEGGYWSGPHYFYNRTVNNVTNINITNVYSKTVIVNRTTVNNASYSGGPGGVVARPTPEQQAAEHESHIQATPMQVQHVQAAHANRALFVSANHGAPPVAATVRPAQFTGPGIVRAQRAPAASAFSPETRGFDGRSAAVRPAPANPNAAPTLSGVPRASGAQQPPYPDAARPVQLDRQGGAPNGASAYPRSGDQPVRPSYNERPEGGAYRPVAPVTDGYSASRAAPTPKMAPPRPQQPHPAARPPAPRPAPPHPHPEPHGEPHHEG